MRYFVAVAEELNFRRAAERLRLSQPALSKQIKDLEHDVGVTLLYRNTGGVRLTDAGVVLLDESRDILERVDMAAAAAREAATGRLGQLSVGNLGAISSRFLPGTLSLFRNRYPQVEVNLQELGIPAQLQALQAGKTHVGFTIDMGEEIPEAFAWMEVLQGRAAVAMSRDHALAHQTKVSLADLLDESFLYMGETERHDLHRERIQAIFSARRLKHRPLRRVNSFESLVALVAGDHGMTIMLPAPRTAENVVFKRIKEDGDDLIVRLLAVWRKNDKSQLAQNFVEVLREQRDKWR